MAFYKMLDKKDIKLLLNERMKKLHTGGYTVDQICSMFGVSRSIFYRYLKENNNDKISPDNETKRNTISILKKINPESKSNLKPKLKQNSKRQVGGQNENSNLDSSNIKNIPSDELFENPILVSNSEKTISKPKEQSTPKPKPKPKPKPQAKPKPKPQAQAKPKPKPKPEPEPQLKSSIIEIGGGNNKSYMTDNSSIDSLDTLSDSNDLNLPPPPKPKAKPKAKPKPKAQPKPKPKAQPKPESKTANEQKNQTGGNIIEKGLEKLKKIQQEAIDAHISGSYSDSDSD